MQTRLARIIHMSPPAACFDPHAPAGRRSSLSERMETLYALMAQLRADQAPGAVPVTVVLGHGAQVLDARLPGLYEMDGMGDLVVSSTDGVDFIERHPIRESVPALVH